MAQAYNPPTVWQPFGAFSQVVLQGPGQIAYIKGQVALDAQGRVVGENTMPAQVEQVLRNLADILASLGGRMSDVLALNQFTTDIQAFMRAGDVRKRFFAPPYPVTTTIEVAALYDPRLLIEINAIVEIPRDRYRAPAGAAAMHG